MYLVLPHDLSLVLLKGLIVTPPLDWDEGTIHCERIRSKVKLDRARKTVDVEVG
jgi:hypothetical protein